MWQEKHPVGVQLSCCDQLGKMIRKWREQCEWTGEFVGKHVVFAQYPIGVVANICTSLKCDKDALQVGAQPIWWPPWRPSRW